jgi:hypothetical protein
MEANTNLTIANLSSEDREKLDYIQKVTHHDLQTSLSCAINSYYQSLHQAADPLARLKRSPLISSFQGDADLAEKSEEIFQSIIEKNS